MTGTETAGASPAAKVTATDAILRWPVVPPTVNVTAFAEPSHVPLVYVSTSVVIALVPSPEANANSILLIVLVVEETVCTVLKKVYSFKLSISMTGNVEPSLLVQKSVGGSMPPQTLTTV